MDFKNFYILALVILLVMIAGAFARANPQFSPPTSPEDFAAKAAEMGSKFPGAGR